jgi:eukaryotic-like serine/threonine-protein kinase
MPEHVATGYHAGELLLRRYLLLQRVAERPGVATWRARELAHGTDITLELIDDPGSTPCAPGPAFLRAAAAAQVRHEALVGVLEVDITRRSETVIVTETSRGVSLSQLHRARGSICADEAVALLLPVASALAAAHAAGLVHGAVSADEIVICSDGRGAARASLGGLAILRGARRGDGGDAAGSEGGEADPTPADDARALAATLLGVLGDPTEAGARCDELRATLDRGLGAGAAGWATVAALSATLERWASSSPVPAGNSIPPSPPGDAPDAPATRRMSAPVPRFTEPSEAAPEQALPTRAPAGWLLLAALAAFALTAASLAAKGSLAAPAAPRPAAAQGQVIGSSR